jgi:hypothetical protein
VIESDAPVIARLLDRIIAEVGGRRADAPAPILPSAVDPKTEDYVRLLFDDDWR